MKPPEEQPQSDPQSANHKNSPATEADFDREFERGLEEVDRSIATLKERYAQIQRDRQRQIELKHHYEDIRQERRRDRSPELLAELRQIQQQLEILEVNLESSLFSWSSLKEPFWMAVRFSGIGLVVGWLLKSLAGN